MAKTHTTKDGRKVLIKDMESSHLLNMINFCVETLGKWKEVVNGTYLEDKTPFLKEFLGEKSLDPEAAIEGIRGFPEWVFPYLYEAWIRGLDLRDSQIAIENILDGQG